MLLKNENLSNQCDMLFSTALLVALPGIFAQESPKGLLPAKGDNGQMGGIFGMGGLTSSSIGKSTGSGSNSGGGGMGSLLATGSESPKGMGGANPNDPGTGPYPAHMLSDPTLPGHTIFAPKSPPPDVKLPVIVWGNGGCLANGASFQVFLTEIASHGYLVVANGASGGGVNSGVAKGGKASKGKGFGGGLLGMFGSSTKVSDLTASIDWVDKGQAAKYGSIDAAKIAAAGQSCGGLEAYSASYHEPRVKLTVLFNSGVIDETKKYLLQELKSPVAFFLGGPKDIAYQNGESDYDLLPKGLPAYKASLDTGHVGTYFAKNGGKFGKAAVAFFNWQFRNDEKAKAICTDQKAPGSLVSDHWNVTFKNFA